MAPESNFSRSLSSQTGFAYKHDDRQFNNDSASIASKSSFGSTVGLIRKKLSPSPKRDRDVADKKKRDEEQKILRNQVNIVG